MSRFKECLEEVLVHEGGFVNHPRDPGGATNMGITIGTFRKYYPGASVTDLRNISMYQVQRIYKEGYWDPIDGDGLGPGVDLCVFDLAVNSGVGRAKKMFRKVMHLHGEDDAELIEQLCDNRLAFMKRIRGGRLWKTFGRGWSRRVAKIRSMSLKALGSSPETGKGKQVPKSTPKAKTLWSLLLELLTRILVR